MNQETRISSISVEVAKTWLSSIPGIPESEWNYFIQNMSERHFPRGSDLIKAGEVCRNLYLVTNGLARYYYVTKDGKEFNKAFAVRGAIVASMISLRQKRESPFFCICAGRLRRYCCSRKCT